MKGGGQGPGVSENTTPEPTAHDAIRRFASSLEVRVGERTAELAEQRALLDAVIETVPVGLVLVDPEGTVVRVNSKALEILRTSSLEAPALAPWRDIEAYDLEGRLVETLPMDRTLATGEVIMAERLEVVFADGHRVIIEVSTAPVRNAAAEMIGGVAVLQDVTVRERQERSEREFVTNAAHELHSPLAAIISAIEVLQAGAKDSADRDRFLTHIERASERLERLVRALLILARAQTALEAPKAGIVAIRPLLEDVAERLQLGPGVEPEVICADDIAVVTNRELLEQAVGNLAENAAKKTSAGKVTLTGRTVGDSVEIGVADTGPGIPAAERPKVFGRFYRTEENGADGFGLGLAIVRAAVEALGGEIELESTLGAGTVVRLRLPNAASLTHP
jgi:PAS domain S-box-containing protein